MTPGQRSNRLVRRLGSPSGAPDRGAARRAARSGRRGIAAGAAVALAAVLVACSSGTSTDGSAVETRSYTDIDGTEMQVPVDPQRVVTLSEPTLDGALALGVTPVGTTSGRGQPGVPNYLADSAGDIELLGSIAQPNFEAIGAVQPDLILVDGTSINNNPPVIEALRRIAPTAFVGYAGGDWRTTFSNVAEALNRADRGAAVLADYDTHVVEVAAALPDSVRSSTFSIVRWQGGSASLILKELPPGRALTDLGLQRPPNQDRDGRGHSEPVSLENLTQIDADYIFFGTLGGSSVDNPQAGGAADLGAAEQALATAASTPGFTRLAAYESGNVIPVDGSVWTSTGGPILMTAIVDDVARELAP